MCQSQATFESVQTTGSSKNHISKSKKYIRGVRGQNSGKSGYMVYVRPLEENSTIKMHENCRRKHNGNALLRKQHQCQR